METFGFRFLEGEVLVFIVRFVVSAREWQEKLQSLKQDSSAGWLEPAELL